jgi:hypothetical protein
VIQSYHWHRDVWFVQDVRTLREIEQFYNTQIEEMPMNVADLVSLLYSFAFGVSYAGEGAFHCILLFALLIELLPVRRSERDATRSCRIRG